MERDSDRMPRKEGVVVRIDSAEALEEEFRRFPGIHEERSLILPPGTDLLVPDLAGRRATAEGVAHLTVGGTGLVVAGEGSTVSALDRVRVEAERGSRVHLRGTASCDARGDARVTLAQNARLRAHATVRFAATDRAQVVADGLSRGSVTDHCTATVGGRASLQVERYATVWAQGRACLVMRGHASAVAVDDVSVTAFGYAHVDAGGAVMVEAAGTVSVVRRSPRAIVAGGTVIDQTRRCDPTRWAQLSGAPRDAQGWVHLYAPRGNLTPGSRMCASPFLTGEDICVEVIARAEDIRPLSMEAAEVDRFRILGPVDRFGEAMT